MMLSPPDMPQDPLLEGVLVRRVWAWLVDLVLVGILVSAATVALFVLGLLTLGLSSPLLVILPAVPLIYHTGFLASRWAATPGQRLLDIAAVRDDDLGQPAPAQALIFTVGLYLTITFGQFLLLAALFTVRARALHDLLSGLTIVRARALTARLAYLNVSGNVDGRNLFG